MLKPIVPALLIAALFTATAAAQTMSAPTTAPARAAYTGTPGDYIAHDFHFGTGETLAQLKLHYLTLGSPHRDANGHVDNAVLLLHGTGGDAHSSSIPRSPMCCSAPASLSTSPNTTLSFPTTSATANPPNPPTACTCTFPATTTTTWCAAQHQMLHDGLHVDHLRLIFGTSMGCMQTFVWGETYPEFADALMPLACLPVQLAGRNRMMRYMAIENIERDPAWKNGDYASEPTEGLRTANEMLLIMGSAPLRDADQLPHPAAGGSLRG